MSQQRPIENPPADRPLRHDEERLSLALEAAELVAWEWDPLTDQVVRSASVARVLGLPEDTALDTSAGFLAVVHPEDRERVRGGLARALHESAVYDEELRVVRPDGSIVWVADRGRVTRRRDGAPARVSGVLANVTERRQVEQVLRANAARLRASLDAGSMGAWEWNLETGVVSWDVSGPEILGVDTARSQPLADILPHVHPADAPLIQEAQDRSMATGRFDVELRVRRYDGEERWLACKGSLIRTPAGAPWKILGITYDITERKQAEQARRASDERFRTSVENLLDSFGIYSAIRDAGGRIVDFRVEYVNRATTIQNGLPREQQVGRRILEILPGHQDSELFAAYCRVTDTGESFEVDAMSFDMELDGRVQRRWFDIRATRLGDGFTAIWRDVTWRHEAETERQEADRRKDEFLATLAHELRNPLAPIRNAVELLRIQGPQAPELRAARDVIERQVQQLARLVDDLLDVSRITRGKLELRKERVSLATVVEQAVEISQPLVVAKQHQLHIDHPSEDVILDADPTRLAQVLANLLNNAAKYTPPGGRVDVVAARAGSELVITVRDSGVGIRAEMLSHIFDMFTQLDGSRDLAQGGLGIGLTLVRHLVEMHGGSVTAHSDGPGSGSELAVRLPLPQDQSTPGQDAAAQSPGDTGQRCVVVADDNRDAADTLAMLLELMGHQVWIAYDGPQALELASAHRPDLVLLDIGMPGMSGHEVARRLRAQPATASAVLVAMTGWGQDADRQRSREAGFDRHEVKPLDPQVLRDILAGHLA